MESVPTRFRELTLRTLKDLKAYRDRIDFSIKAIEAALGEEPYSSNLDFEAIRLEALEHHVSWHERVADKMTPFEVRRMEKVEGCHICKGLSS